MYRRLRLVENKEGRVPYQNSFSEGIYCMNFRFYYCYSCPKDKPILGLYLICSSSYIGYSLVFNVRKRARIVNKLISFIGKYDIVFRFEILLFGYFASLVSVRAIW